MWYTPAVVFLRGLRPEGLLRFENYAADHPKQILTCEVPKVSIPKSDAEKSIPDEPAHRIPWQVTTVTIPICWSRTNP